MGPQVGVDNKRLTPIEDLKEFRIYPSPHQVIKISTSLTEEEEHELVNRLIRNVDLFTWTPYYMLEIDTRVLVRCLSIKPSANTVAQRKWKVNKEKRDSIEKEVGKLFNVWFIIETKYPSWMTNVMFIRLTNNR